MNRRLLPAVFAFLKAFALRRISPNTPTFTIHQVLMACVVAQPQWLLHCLPDRNLSASPFWVAANVGMGILFFFAKPKHHFL